MKNIILATLFTLLFIGCGTKADYSNVEPQLEVGKSLESLHVNNQYEKPQSIPADTKIAIFSFSKPTGHICKEYFEKQPADFLSKNKAVYVADVSAAPSLIKSMFIIPGLKDLKFSVLLIDDEKVSAQYSKGFGEEDIVVVYLENKKIKDIKKIHSEEELAAVFTPKQ